MEIAILIIIAIVCFSFGLIIGGALAGSADGTCYNKGFLVDREATLKHHNWHLINSVKTGNAVLVNAEDLRRTLDHLDRACRQIGGEPCEASFANRLRKSLPSQDTSGVSAHLDGPV